MDLLHRVTQARNVRSFVGVDQVLRDVEKYLQQNQNVDDLHTQIGDLATKLTLAEEEIQTLKKPKTKAKPKAKAK